MIFAILVWCLVGAPSREVQRTIPTDTLITLRRTNCFFRCPDYLVTISGEGKVIFEGNANVRIKGRSETTISQDKVQLLIASFEKAKFFSLRNRYLDPEDGCRLADGDSSTVTISIVVNGKSKSIDHYLGCYHKNGSAVRSLFKLENLIDDLANTAQWID